MNKYIQIPGKILIYKYTYLYIIIEVYKMTEATVLFHQGYTDILNHLPLLSYYQKKFKKLHVIIREEAVPILQQYLLSSKYSNIEMIVMKKNHLDILFVSSESIRLFLEIQNLTKTYLLFFGIFDVYRDDRYKHAFNNAQRKGIFFSEAFYTAYDLPYSLRLDEFEYDRSSRQIQTIEHDLFKKFCFKHSIDIDKPFEYILYHDDETTKAVIEFSNKSSSLSLNKMSNSFFDCLKILENAKELHLIDSSWACLTYFMDAKYGFMKEKKVFLYAKRDYGEMFRSPKVLLNWNIISR